jgi:hypothetical protein
MSKHSLRLGGGKWAVKEDKLLAYAEGDISGKFLPQEMTFSRGSDIGATRINKQGLIEKSRENLFTYSNDFRRSAVSDAPWSHNGLGAYFGPQNNPSDVPNGEMGYDGSGGASFLRSNDSTAGSTRKSVILTQTVVGSQTISIYAKAGGYDFFALRTSNSNVSAYFNLATGEIGTKGSEVIDAQMIDVGSGWYRCAIVGHASLTSVSFNACRQDNEFEFVGDGVSGIFIQDAQRERGLVATKYLESATSTTGKSGHSEDMPRIDYRNGKPQLLLEPKRKNLVPRSESLEFTGSHQRVAMDFGYMSPEGVKNAYKVTAIPDAGDPISHFFISNQFTITASRKYCVSAFVKPLGDLTHIRFGFSNQNGTDAIYSYFDLTGDGGKLNETANGTGVEIDNFGIEKVGSDGWFRVFVAGDLGSITAAKVVCFLAPNATTTAFTGDNETSALWYGLQCEVELTSSNDEGNAAQAPTSYIPTYDTAVTREHDEITHLTSTSTDGITGNYNTTVFFDGVNHKNFGNTRFITLNNTSGGSLDPRVLLFTGGNSGGKFRIYAQFRKNNTPSDDVEISGLTANMVRNGDEFKCLLRLNGTKMALYIDGVKQGDDVTIEKQEDIESFDLTQHRGDLNFHVNDIQSFAFAMSDLDCEVLTTNTTFNSFADMSETLNYNS